MLVAAAGWLAGYRGDFEFPSGSKYPATVNYVGMRMVLAAFGALLVPIVYRTALQMRFSPRVAIVAGLMALMDVGLIGISRLILLDSMLIFFATLAVYFYSRFRNASNRPFSTAWCFSLGMTGLAIGCVSSVKWVGFCITALIGLLTIEELVEVLRMRKKMLLVAHFAARVIGLIVIPVAVYVGSFYLHFLILNHSGTGDGNMSSLFQARLEGSALTKGPVHVHYGSRVTIKNTSYGGGLLHSHVQLYPEGSMQQQVTTYIHKDTNNDWVIMPASGSTEKGPVKNGDQIRLLHRQTNHLLHSHSTYMAPVSKHEYEVTGYGSVGTPDTNDTWRIEVIKELAAHDADGSLRTLTTQFCLRHASTGCLLKAHNVQLPEWGFKQGEVTCDPNPRSSGRAITWNIEEHVNPSLPEGQAKDYPSSFWDDLRDCNVGMWLINNALRQDPEIEPSILTSTPLQWFFMAIGIRMSSWNEDAVRFYMLGNPLVWWPSSVAVVLNVILAASYFLAEKRQVHVLTPDEKRFFYYRFKLLTGGWAFNYLPFFLVGRVMYVHHYYPALVMSILNFAFLLEHIASLAHWKKGVRQQTINACCVGIVLILTVAFVYFGPLAYGMTGPHAKYAWRRWLPGWSLY